MAEIRQYILSVIASAIICAISIKMVGNTGFIPSVIKLLTGLFVVYTVVSPWSKIQIYDFSSYLSDLKLDGSIIAAEGKESAELAGSELIKQQVESYILEKAQSIGVALTADIIIDNSDYRSPKYVTISGSASPYNRQCIMQMISDELGIPKENLTWK